MIGIVDYGLGNVASVLGAVEHLGFEGEVTGDPARLSAASKLILPGVGAFGDGMRNLADRGLVEVLNDLVLHCETPILGICLGCQLLTRESDEFGQNRGLGWIDADVRRFPSGQAAFRVPHVGWNDTRQVRNSALFDGLSDEALFYYVHSHHIVAGDSEAVVAECDYGVSFATALVQKNIYGVQFHPEKSQRDGLKLLGNFIEKC